jgi:hypothetical protein
VKAPGVVSRAAFIPPNPAPDDEIAGVLSDAVTGVHNLDKQVQLLNPCEYGISVLGLVLYLIGMLVQLLNPCEYGIS